MSPLIYAQRGTRFDPKYYALPISYTSRCMVCPRTGGRHDCYHLHDPLCQVFLTLILSLKYYSSLRSHYRIANHIKPTFYYRSNSSQIVRALTTQAMDFCTLARGQALEALEDDNIPPGWCVKVVSESLSLLLNLNGVIDCNEEIRRLEKEVARYEERASNFFNFVEINPSSRSIS